MACGVAVVAPALGQIAEVVKHGKSGLLYPAGDTNALAVRCGELLRRPRLRAALGKAAAALVRAHYTWPKNAARVADIARACIAARR
jgi:glycosyltransferase involved in cell wall biosynthesis